MFEKLQLLKAEINGPEAKAFREDYFARFFTGYVTLVFGKETYTLFFREGVLIDIAPGAAMADASIGVSGSMEAWNDYFKTPIFGRAMMPIRENPLAGMGPPLLFRQNYNVLSYLCKVLAKVVNAQ